MQNPFRITSLFLPAAIILLCSCSKTNKQGRYIPENAGVVIHINGKSITEKLSAGDGAMSSGFRRAIADSAFPAFVKNILDNSDSSGVDNHGDFELFIVKDSSGSYIGAEGAIRDEAKFQRFIEDADAGAKKTEKNGRRFYTTDQLSLGFDKDRFIVTLNPAAMPLPGMQAGVDDLPTGPIFNMPGAAKPARDWAALTASLFDLDKSSSLAGDDHFTALVNNRGDVHFWYNAQYLHDLGFIGKASAVINTDMLFNGAAVAGTVNFEKSKITCDVAAYAGKELRDIVKKYTGDGFDRNMVRNIPSSNVAALLIMNGKPEGIRALLAAMNLDGFVNLYLANAQLSLDEIVQATGGDVMLAVTDIKKDSNNYFSTPQYFLSTSIKNKSSFTKLVRLAKTSLSQTRADEELHPVYLTGDRYFVFSNDSIGAENYLAGNAQNDRSFLPAISGGPVGGYVNFQYIFSALKNAAGGDSGRVAALDASLKTWDDLIISGGDFKDGGNVFHCEINLTDKNTNSLRQLSNYMAAIRDIRKQQRKERDIWETNALPAEDVPARPILKPLPGNNK